jgi:hypothetical protein
LEAPEKHTPDPAGQTSPGWLGLLQRVGGAVVPALLTAGGLLGFVAFAGSVIVWTRFSAAEVPPDQVVAAFPRGELVAIASALLLLFGFFGLIAVIVFFLINKEGSATIGVSRGLLALLAVEGMVAILLVESSSLQDRALAGELFLLPTIVAFWATFVYERPDLSKDPEAPDESDETSGFSDRVGDFREDFVELLLLRSEFANTVLTTVVLVAPIAVFLTVVIGLPTTRIAIAALACIGIFPTLRLLRLWIDNPGPQRTLQPGEVPFTRRGQALIIALLPVAAIGPFLVLGNGWLPFSLIAAAGLIAGLWRVAVLSQGKFMWYGLAVFISVPLFGTLTLMARNVADPQIQPMALIRKADGPAESLQGLYVTETESRIYFATVATEGCTDILVPHSGRLLWVPKSEVVAMSVGPLQSVDDAAKTALEMSYALTPAVETPAGDHVSLTAAEKRRIDEHTEESRSTERRLESVGAAVQPNFGAGVHLDPERVSPGDTATLRMSLPNRKEGVDGFGRYREGRTLRLGGVPVDIAKEEAQSAWDAEYVETGSGEALTVTKHTVYRRSGEDEYQPVNSDEDTEGQQLFVEVSDGSVAELRGGGQADGSYLELETGREEPPHLASSRSPEAVLRDGTTVVLKPRLLRQAWHEDHIKFRVPEKASTGPVTVECEQLAGQPLLRISRPPEPHIAVHIEPGSQQVVFDSSGSVDLNGEIVSRRWSTEGLDSGHAVRIAENLPARLESYSIRLTVTDASGQSGRTELHLLRLPEDLVDSDNDASAALRQAKAALRRTTAHKPASTIEFEARPADLPGGEGDAGLSLADVEKTRRRLLQVGSAQAAAASANSDGLILKTRAYGTECPAEESSHEGRLDILVLGQGVRVVSSRGCPPARAKTMHWLLAPR